MQCAHSGMLSSVRETGGTHGSCRDGLLMAVFAVDDRSHVLLLVLIYSIPNFAYPWACCVHDAYSFGIQYLPIE